MPSTRIDSADVLELVEILGLLRGWFTRDRETLDRSLVAFIGSPRYDLADLLRDLDRFRFLLGDDAEDDLFGPGLDQG
jgi:hypothetical protein